jgi:DNA-binding CsgD family transcriptional regulator
MKGMLKSLNLGDLSPREREVLRLAADGRTDNSICAHLGIAHGTLGTYWSRIRNKTGTSSRAELAAAYVRHRFEKVIVRTVALVAERTGPGGSPPCGRNPSMAEEVFDSIPVAALVVGTDGKIVALNQMAATIFGQRPKAGSCVSRFLFSRDVAGFETHLKTAVKTNVPARFQANVVSPQGLRHCHWVVKPLVPDARRLMLLLSEAETMEARTRRTVN